jgi:dTDP-4-dehydrorhamnose 3,5-epimerase
MRFTPLRLQGAWIIDLEPISDSRGFFARSYCEREFAAHGLSTRFVQCNVSFNAAKGTLRGMHYQREPAPEVKLVRCTRGAAWDVIIDLRPDSPTYCNWEAVEITGENYCSVYIPAGFAHGFQTLVDGTELLYQMGEYFIPELAAGVRWNDPTFRIEWPMCPPVVSARDQNYPDFDAERSSP